MHRTPPSACLLPALASVALWGALACGAPAPDAGAAATLGEPALGELRLAVRGGTPAHECEWPGVAAVDLGCSATLVHPEVIVYAAHCGTGVQSVSFGETLALPQRVVRTRRCGAHPGAALGNGLDVAFCLLAEPIADIPAIPIAAGCELDRLGAGTSAQVTGFGPSVEGGSFGIKRSAPVVLGSIALDSTDLVLEAAQSGTCGGDSGAPLLIGAEAGRDPTGARVIGVVSASNTDTCGPNTDHYSFLPPLLPWLEAEAGRDLTPCFDADGRWDPTRNCTTQAPLEASWSTGCVAAATESTFATSCGPGFAPERLSERTPPELELVAPAALSVQLLSRAGVAETFVEADASDAESGMAEVRFEIRDEQGVQRAAERDEVPPYRLDSLRLPVGSWEVVVTARDQASNESEERRWFMVGERDPSCGLTHSSKGWPALVVAGLALAACTARRVQNHRARTPRSA